MAAIREGFGEAMADALQSVEYGCSSDVLEGEGEGGGAVALPGLQKEGLRGQHDGRPSNPMGHSGDNTICFQMMLRMDVGRVEGILEGILSRDPSWFYSYKSCQP